jgi:hypothetical protein
MYLLLQSEYQRASSKWDAGGGSAAHKELAWAPVATYWTHVSALNELPSAHPDPLPVIVSQTSPSRLAIDLPQREYVAGAARRPMQCA